MHLVVLLIMGTRTDSKIIRTGPTTLERYGDKVINYAKDNTTFIWHDYNPHTQATVCYKGSHRFNIWLNNQPKGDTLVKVSLVHDTIRFGSDFWVKSFFPKFMRLEELAYVVEQDGQALVQLINKLQTQVMVLAVDNDDPADLLSEFEAWTPPCMA